MTRREQGGLPAGVQKLGERIERWRQTRLKGTVMPAELWAEAARLARRGRPYAIARALNINFEALTRRVGDVGEPVIAPPAGPFVELSGAQILAPPMVSTGSVVEVVAKDGARLTIRLGAAENLDVASMVQTFCSRRA